MPLVVVGLNHKTAPIELLERLAIPDEDVPKALDALMSYEHVLEGAVLSTCNRIEVLGVVARFHGGAQDMRNFLSELRHVAPEDFADHLYTYHDEGAARHLFRVAAGIDSMVVGESEILGQVRRAFARATEQGTAGPMLSHALRRALHVGRRARVETAIGRNPASISSAAVELARRGAPGGSLAGKNVLVVGAGKMGALALQVLGRAGVGDVVVLSRSEASARRAASSTAEDVAAGGLDELEDALARADIVICSTTAATPVLLPDLVAAAVERRDRPGPLTLIDIAVPRDVDPSVAELDGVVVHDIYDLRAVVDAGVGSRIAEISKVEELIAHETERFAQEERARELAPVLATLVGRAEEIRRAELDRGLALVRGLSEEDRRAVEDMTRRIVAKLLHTPLERARALAGAPQGPLYMDAMRELFELDDAASP
ncbi:MAG TPA: glutamyl-tRNA reductase [Actinomycetota bacterium]|nr:glutamyl-tRNA reductase [Actinomycetota bacterium]